MLDIDRRPSYDVALMRDDMAAKGWNASDLARRAEVSDMAVSRFLRKERQTARMAKKLASALNYSVRRYLVSAKVASDTVPQSHEEVEARPRGTQFGRRKGDAAQGVEHGGVQVR